MSLTLDRYSHLFDGLDAEIADGLDVRYRNTPAAYSRPARGLTLWKERELPPERSRCQGHQRWG